MRSNWHRALLVSFVLIMSSLAGCIGTDDEDELEEGQYGTVMVSTYHVGEIVKAIAGDTVNVEMMSQNNIPVHDYSPALEDIVRLGDADLFLYHGLGLEPWVDSTLEGLGSDAPAYAMVHTMPTGEISLDYETMLVDKLCDSLSSPSATVIHMLAEHAEDAGELHGDDGAHNLGFPEDDHDGHDDHGEEDHDDEHSGDHDDHDDHGDDDHDGHGDHDEHDHGDHEMLMPEDSLEASSDCPTGTVISVYHFEAGEYMLEFEGEDVETFMMAIAAMGGAHHHHHHGHGDGPFEWAGIFEMNDDSHTWTMEKKDGSYADPSMRVVLIPTDTPTEETMHSLESGVESLIEGDECTIIEDGESMTPVDGGSCFEWHVGTGDISTFTINTAGISGLAAYTAHSPYEFEATQHYLKDSAGNDVEHVAEEGGGGHGDHGDHGDDDHDDHDDHGDDDHDGHEDHGDHDEEEMHAEDVMAMFDSNSDGYLSLEEFMEGMESMEDEDDHDNDHGDEEDHVCHNTLTHENTNDSEDSCGAYTYLENHTMGNETFTGCYNTMTHQVTLDNESACGAYMWMDPADHGHDDHDFEHEFEEAFFGHYFNEADADEDGLLDMTELETLAETMNNMEGDVEMDLMIEIYMTIFDEDEDGVLSVEEFTEMMEMMMSMDEDGHDEHDDHDHGDHDDENSGDHDDHDDDMNMTAMAEMMFAMFDTNEDGSLDESEVHAMMEGMMGEEHEEGVAFIGLHIEEEGEYGIALPAGVELHVLMAGGHEGHDHGSHDDHDDHSGHDDHDDHADEDDHDDHADEDDHDDHAEEELAYDPHSWLDPVAMAAQADVVLAKLIEVFPDGEDVFTENANAFKAELVTLDDKYKTLTSSCSDRTVAANHNAYSYLAYRYDIDFVTVHGLDPEGEPSAEDVVKVVDRIEEDSITVLFVEEYTDQSSVQSIVDETGVSIQILYTMEMAPSDSSDDYLSMMNKNFESLEAGMSCSA